MTPIENMLKGYLDVLILAESALKLKDDPNSSPDQIIQALHTVQDAIKIQQDFLTEALGQYNQQADEGGQ